MFSVHRSEASFENSDVISIDASHAPRSLKNVRAYTWTLSWGFMSIHRNTGAAQSGLQNIVENIADSKVLPWKIHFLFFSNKIERITFLTRVQRLLLGPFKTVLCSIRVLDCHSPLFSRKIVRRDTGGYLALWPPVKAKWSISKNLRENRRLWTVYQSTFATVSSNL